MPIMYGIAAFAVLATGADQTGVDPQIDKQYAIVKQGGGIAPTAPPSTVPDEDAQSTARAAAERNSTGRASTIVIAQGGLTTSAGSRAEAPVAYAISGQAATLAQGTSAPASPFGHATTISTTGSPIAFFSNDNLSKLKGMDRSVSVQFNNATASDVLKWLNKQNVNYVANVDKLPKSKITMNVSNVPLHEALGAVADALGGSWQVKGSTLIFQAGMFHSLTSAPAIAGFDHGFTFAPMKGLNFEKMDEKQLKEFEKSMLDFKGQMKTFDLKAMPKMDSKAFSEMKNLHGFSKDGKAFEFKMDPKALAEMKKLQGNLFLKDGKAMTIKPDGKNPFINMKGFGEMKGLTFKKIDTEKFSKSLSTMQKDLMKKQGYLKFSDLTETQKAMMFDGSTKDLPQDFTFTFSVNGERIVIKSK